MNGTRPQLGISMVALRKINLSAAIIVLICFLMPWEQVSCGGARDTISGLDLARHGQNLLWIVPVLMVVLLVSLIFRIRREQNNALLLANALCGFIASYLMNRERLRVHDESGLIAVRLTGWFWLGFISSLVVGISGIWLWLRRQRAP